MRLEYPTPETLPTGTTCRSLFIPDNELIIGAVTGALKTLINPDNWEKLGAITPEEAAEALVPMFDAFCFRQGFCRMVGEILLWSGKDVPDNENLLLCDGTHYDSADYPELYDTIGTTYGGSGASDFAVPDLRGRVPIGENVDHALGSEGGAERVTLTQGEMPVHTHTDSGHTHAESIAVPAVAQLVVAPQPAAVPGIGVTGIGFAGIQNTGGGASHDNMQPFIALQYYIVASP